MSTGVKGGLLTRRIVSFAIGEGRESSKQRSSVASFGAGDGGGDSASYSASNGFHVSAAVSWRRSKRDVAYTPQILLQLFQRLESASQRQGGPLRIKAR